MQVELEVVVGPHVGAVRDASRTAATSAAAFAVVAPRLVVGRERPRGVLTRLARCAAARSISARLSLPVVVRGSGSGDMS